MEPWYFVASGTTLTIGSTIVGWITTHRLESKKNQITTQLSEAKRKVEDCRLKAMEASITWRFAEIAGASSFRFAMKYAFEALIMRLEAADEDGVAQSERLQAESINSTQLATEWNSALSLYINHYNNLIKMIEHQTEVYNQTDVSIATSKSVATSLQILGVLLILFKDLSQVV